MLAAGLIYAANQNGETFVFKADPKEFVLLEKNGLNGTINASPVAAKARLYLRTDSHLYCVGRD